MFFLLGINKKILLEHLITHWICVLYYITKFSHFTTIILTALPFPFANDKILLMFQRLRRSRMTVCHEHSFN